MPKKWKLLIVLLGLTCAILVVIIILMAIRFHRNATDKEDPICKSPFQHKVQLDDSSPNLFQDLTTGELNAVRDYLMKQTGLNLTAFSKATLQDNFIYSIELFLPEKAKVLKYLDEGGPQPNRQARVIIFHGFNQSPYVQEYLVQYLPTPSKHVKLQLKNRKTTVPYYGRPFTFKDARESHDLMKTITEEAYPLLKESFGSWFHNCTNHCLSFSAIGEPARHEANKRFTWVRPKLFGVFQ